MATIMETASLKTAGTDESGNDESRTEAAGGGLAGAGRRRSAATGRSMSARETVGREADLRRRARQMRRARWNTLAVRTLRFALPLAALGLIGTFALSVHLSLPSATGVTLGPVSISTENLTIQNPRYEGFSKDGGRFVVTARSAVQDFKQTKPVELEGIKGDLVQPDRTVTRLVAANGLFDTKTNQMELMGGIDVASENGLTARLSRATVLTKESRIISREPVEVTMPSGTIRSQQMELDQKTRQIAFIEAVETRLLPQSRPTSTAPADAASPAPGRSQPQGFGRSDLPVDVRSARLDVDDTAKTALFTGAVRAAQGEALLETEALEVIYENAPAGAGSPTPATPTSADSGKVKRIISRGPVVLHQGADRATGDAADFDTVAEVARLDGSVTMTSGADRRASADAAEIDNKADTILLTGRVHVQQARNELKGRRLLVDRKAGRSRLSSPPEASLAAGRIAARFFSAETGKPNAGAPANGKTSKGGASEAVADTAGPLGMTSFRTDPDAPVDVEADTLDVDDTQRTAVFRGDVRAVQGEFKIRTLEMTAFYTGSAGLAAAPGAPAASAAAPAANKQAAQLTRIEARRKVHVTSKDGQTATGDWADFDTKANTVTLGGDVVLTQGKNIVRGTRLLIDMTSGESRILTGSANDPVGGPPPARPATVAGPATAIGPQGPFVSGGLRRPSMVLYPNKAKEAAKDAAKAVPAETKKDVTDAAKDAATALKGAAPAAVRRRIERTVPDVWSAN